MKSQKKGTVKTAIVRVVGLVVGGAFSHGWLNLCLALLEASEPDRRTKNRKLFTDIIKWPHPDFIRPFTLQSNTHTHTRTSSKVQMCELLERVCIQMPTWLFWEFWLYVISEKNNSISRYSEFPKTTYVGSAQRNISLSHVRVLLVSCSCFT